MSSDSRSHLNTSFQRRFLRIFLGVAAIVILALVPLILMPGLRLDIAHRFDLAPGAGIEQVAAASDGVELIVAPIEIQRPNSRPQYRFRAVYLARERTGGVELTSIDTGAIVIVPLEAYDFVAAAPDATTILLRDERDPAAPKGVLVDVASGSLTPLPSESPYPDVPGRWTDPVWSRTIGNCDGISPNASYIACFQNPALASYLAGDWQLDVHIYGDVEREISVYRGEGFRPFVGWSNDDRWLYFQNEHGIWRASVTEDMFPPSDNRV